MFVIDPDLERTINIMGALKEKAVSHFEFHLLGRIKGKSLYRNLQAFPFYKLLILIVMQLAPLVLLPVFL